MPAAALSGPKSPLQEDTGDPGGKGEASLREDTACEGDTEETCVFGESHGHPTNISLLSAC